MKFEKIKKIWDKILEYKYIDVIFTILYTAILYLAYLVFIQENVNQYYKIDFNVLKCFISILGILILFILNRKLKKNKWVYFFMTLFYYLMFIPCSLIYCGKNYSTKTYLFIFLQFVIIYFILLYKFRNESKKVEKKNKMNSKLTMFSKFIYIMCIVITIVVFIGCIYYNGIPGIKAANLSKVYEVRETFYLPKYLDYLFTFETQFILVFLMVLYIDKKKYSFGLITIALQFIFFLWKGDKITLLSIPLCIGIYVLFKKGAKNVVKNTQALFIIAVIISVLVYKIVPLVYGMFVMRLSVAPANLKFIYFDFFETHPKLGILGTSLNAILKFSSPYEGNYQNYISEIYFDKPEMYSNTGFLAEGFARFGIIGVFLVPIIVALVLYVICSKINEDNQAYIMGISILPLMSLNDKFAITSLTFGSLLCLLVIIYFFDKERIKIKPDNLTLIKKFFSLRKNKNIGENNEKI